MANFTASIDDQQERHYIGNLLVDEEVFGQTTNNTFANSSAHQPSGPSILTGSGPLGPSPNQNFWPEPPPPYSPYSCGPTHLPSFERHPPSFFVQPVDGNVYTPTATAVTRTDFYQAPFSSTGEWEGTPGRGINPYVPIGSPLPYPPQTGIMIVKPMMPPQGSVSPMQHHINNIYHHHQQHRLVRGTQYAMTSAMGQADRVPLSIPLFAPDYSSLPPPNPQAPVLPRCDQKVAPKSFSVPFVHVPPNDTSSTLPPGKSYRDAASKVFASPECCAESPASSYVSVVRQPSLNLTGDNENSEKSVVSYVSTDFVRNSSHSGNGGHDNNEFKDIDKRTCSNEKFPESVSVPEAVKSVSRSRSDESEFQKITHKKSRGGRNKKKEKRIFGEEGNGAVVDTPSRFSVLQSLNSQVSGSHMKHTILRQAASNPEHKSEVDEDASKESRRDDNNRSGSKGVSELQNGLSESRKKNEVGKSRDDYVQRSSSKKASSVSRREQSEHGSGEGSRGLSRKHRSVIKQKQNSLLFYTQGLISLCFLIIKRAAQWIFELIVDISLQLKVVVMFCLLFAYSSITLSCLRFWYSAVEGVKNSWNQAFSSVVRSLWACKLNQRECWGLNENIELPLTGEETINRLLHCVGQDAYVVLGLRADCLDDDIKRYYKRQAILVHPDKNFTQGAEEAFKILSKAFDAIGTKEDRMKYSLANIHKDPLYKEMEELWNQLKQKVTAARNTMYCDCGDKHIRFPVENMRAHEARYCNKCKVRHPAKHNDIWAETRVCGLWWVYYACLDGVVYDITQWASCPCNHLKHMKANGHLVQYRLVSSGQPSMAKGENSSKYPNNKRSCYRQHSNCLDHKEYSDESSAQDELNDYGCSIANSINAVSASASSRQTNLQPHERRAYNTDRPRCAGRRRRMK